MKKTLALVLLLSSTTLFAEVNQTNPMQEQKVNNLYYQGTAVTIKQGGSYTYIEVKEKTELTFWIAVSHTQAKVGDYIRFQKEIVAKDFKSKALNETFKEIMFASNLEYKVIK